jgi:hypothetical protein
MKPAENQAHHILQSYLHFIVVFNPNNKIVYDDTNQQLVELTINQKTYLCPHNNF